MNHLEDAWLDRIHQAVVNELFRIADEENGDTPDSLKLRQWARKHVTDDKVRAFAQSICHTVYFVCDTENPVQDEINSAVCSIVKLCCQPGR